MKYKTANKSKVDEIYQKIKNLKKEKLFLIEDIKTLEIAIDYRLKPVTIFITEKQLKHTAELLNSSDMIKDKIFIISEKSIRKLKQVKTNPGIIALFKSKKNKGVNKKSQYYIALDKVQDPGNVGTILRSALSFNIGKVLLSKGCASIFNPKVIRGSMGASFIQDAEENLSLKEKIKQLKAKGFKVYLTSSDIGKRIDKIEILAPSIIVFGNESKGISKEIEETGDIWLKIPTKNKFDSLNVGVASSIIMYELFKRG